MSALSGKRVALTRPRAQADSFAEKLRAVGAQPIFFPTIAIAPPLNDEPLRRALAALTDFDWVVFTSVNGVEAAAPWLENRPWPAGVRVAAIGPATAQAARGRGWSVDFQPDEFIAEAVAAGLGDVAGQCFLLPRADIARPALARDLRAKGATVTEIAAYRTVAATPDEDGRAELRRGVDALTFTSASTVRFFMELGGRSLLGGALPVIACIGPITAEAARAASWDVAVTAPADDYTTDGLISALTEYFGARI